MKNTEVALITKVLTTKDIYPVLNVNAEESFSYYKDVWLFIVDHHRKYREVPPLEIIQGKFKDFEPEEIDTSVDFLIQKLHEDKVRRELNSIIIDVAADIHDQPIEALQRLMTKTSSLGFKTHVFKDIDLANDYWIRVESLKERAEKKGTKEILGVPTLIDPIDYIYGGFKKGDFITLIGWSEAGKSWVASLLALNAWRMGYSPLYFSLEMDHLEFAFRIDTLLAGGKFSNTSLMNGHHIDIKEYESWAELEFSGKHPFHLVTNEGLHEVTQNTIMAKIEQYRPGLVVIDYHSLLVDARKGQTPTEQAMNISKDLKRIATTYGVPIIDIVAVTQQEGYGKRVPELNEVAWSKQIAYDSDLCLGIFREGDIMTIESKKSRKSAKFAFKLIWNFDEGIATLDPW